MTAPKLPTAPENINAAQSSDNHAPERVARLSGLMADAAARTILPLFRKPLQIDNKLNNVGFDPVTIADRDAELAIRKIIRQHFDDDGILGEEHEDVQGTSGYTWILDPIDGTRAFITGVPQWGTLIGLNDGASTVYGVMNQPFLQERYCGDGQRATLTSPHHQLPLTLKTRDCATLSDAMLMCTSIDMFSQAERERFTSVANTVAMTRFGGDCYAYCMLASGFIDLVIEADLKPYDIQALIPIVEGAGGVVTDWQGGNVTGGGAVIAAGDKRIHAAALNYLAQQ